MQFVRNAVRVGCWVLKHFPSEDPQHHVGFRETGQCQRVRDMVLGQEGAHSLVEQGVAKLNSGTASGEVVLARRGRGRAPVKRRSQCGADGDARQECGGWRRTGRAGGGDEVAEYMPI